MYHPVSAKCFNANDHQLFAHGKGGRRLTREQAIKIRENRRLIQIYLFKIQQRINRGYLSGAMQLFNRLLQRIELPYWAIAALRSELKRPPR